MKHHFTFGTLDDSLQGLCSALLGKGEKTGSRNGETMELTHVGVQYLDPMFREILNPERKVNIAAQLVETAWVLAGRNDIEFLSHYLPRAKDYSDDGKTWRAGYGPRIRNWAGVDQLQYVVDTLLDEPLSRQAVIGIWDPFEDTLPGKDRACNDLLIFTSRLGYLDLQVTVRSNDVIWGHSAINMHEWSVLQEVVAHMLGVRVGELHFSIASLHLYAPHYDKARKIVETPRGTGYPLPPPRFNMPGSTKNPVEQLDELLTKFFEIEQSIRENGPSQSRWQVEEFPEPMLKSWLRVLQWWWSGDDVHLRQLTGTRLFEACTVAMQPKPAAQPAEPSESPQKAVDRNVAAFVDSVTALHTEKHAAYGNSWKARGETFSILPNIARKIDRLGSGTETADETSSDTASDLLVYLCKWVCWLVVPEGEQHLDANAVIRTVSESYFGGPSDGTHVKFLTTTFNAMLDDLDADRYVDRRSVANRMIVSAFALAYSRWATEQDQYRGADME